jgi:hypothetical protein
MPLIDVHLPTDDDPIPAMVREFLAEAERRIVEFQQHARFPGFVPSDYHGVYRLLRGLASTNLTGKLFCEWGSGFGVIACLASMLGFDAVGIEIEADLVAVALKLADDFDLPVEFVQGSFIPKGGSQIYDDLRGGNTWLCTDEARANQLELAISDFDVIFVYPWPDDAGGTERLFERFAQAGAILATYHAEGKLRGRRKVAQRRQR